MGCRILGNDMCCFYDSVTDIAFGPVAPKEELEEFRNWLGQDPRELENIKEKWEEFLDIPEEEK